VSGQPGTFVSPLGLVAALYLILLPVAQLVVVPLGGAMATEVDLALGGLVAAGLVAEAVPLLCRAWLAGSAAALLLLVGALVGQEALRGRVLFDAGAVRGLPLPRTRGPFLHPTASWDATLP